MRKKKVTFDDIARYTGFSKTTISRFFNKPETLTEKNQEIIRQALTELDYKENKVARILARGKTEFIGIILPSLYLHYFSDMLSQILLTYEEYGYKFLVFVGNEHPDVEKQYIEELMSYQIEGLIVMSHTLSSKELSGLPIPVVAIEREDEFISSVNCDNYMGAVQAVSLLAKHNCDILIHVNAPTSENIPAYNRIRGFEDFCREHELRHEVYIKDTGYSHASFNKVLGEFLEEIEEKYPTEKKGIFFSDDTRANCFLNLLIRKYSYFPDNYKLVGFDNSPIAEDAVYPLTTVGQQIGEIAHEAVVLLSELMDKKKQDTDASLPVIHKVVTPQLFRRETTEL